MKGSDRGSLHFDGSCPVIMANEKYFIGEIADTTYKAERRIDLFSTASFALVSRDIPGPECENLRGTPYVWRVIKALPDRKGETFYICEPMVKLSALRSNGRNDSRIKIQVIRSLCDGGFISTDEAQILRRMARANNIPFCSDADILTVQAKIIELLAKKVVTDEQLLQQANTPIRSTPEQAKLIPTEIQSELGIGIRHAFPMVDKLNLDCRVNITTDNLDTWKPALPEYFIISKEGENIRVDLDMDKVDVSLDSNKIPDYNSFLPFIHMHVIVNKTGERLQAFIEKDDKNFDEYMSALGLCYHEKYFIPRTFPAWKPGNSLTEDRVEKLHDPIFVVFDNGMKGWYPAIYMVKKYPGSMADNFTVRVLGHSIETMQFLFSPKW